MEAEKVCMHDEHGEFAGYAHEAGFRILDDDGEIFAKKCFLNVESNPHPDHPTNVHQGIRAMYARSCSCEHDCCGHYFGGVNGSILYKAGMYEFKVRYYRNV